MLGFDRAVERILDVMMPVKPPDMTTEEFRRMQKGVATKYVEVATDVLLQEAEDTQKIVFEREAFDEFMVQIAAQQMLTPVMGGMLNDLLEHELTTDAYEVVGWMKRGQFGFGYEFGAGPAENGEEVLYRRRGSEPTSDTVETEKPVAPPAAKSTLDSAEQERLIEMTEGFRTE